MFGWECGGCWRGYCRVVTGAQRALSRLVIEGYLIGLMLFIFRVFLFTSHIPRFLLLLLLFAFGSSKGKSTEGRSQALQRIIPRPT